MNSLLIEFDKVFQDLRIEEILQYIIVPRKKPVAHPISRLEQIVTPSENHRNPTTLGSVPVSTEFPSLRSSHVSKIKKIENSINEKRHTLDSTLLQPEFSIVRYEFFIASNANVKYKSMDIKYSVGAEKENLEISLTDDTSKVSLQIDKPSTERGEYVLHINYSEDLGGYFVRYEAIEYANSIEKARQDFTNKLDKALELLPKSLMGGILGFTYIGQGKMTRRDDLFGDMALMVDVHEAIHTPDEYETRVLTEWMLKIERPRYSR